MNLENRVFKDFKEIVTEVCACSFSDFLAKGNSFLALCSVSDGFASNQFILCKESNELRDVIYGWNFVVIRILKNEIKVTLQLGNLLQVLIIKNDDSVTTTDFIQIDPVKESAQLIKKSFEEIKKRISF